MKVSSKALAGMGIAALGLLVVGFAILLKNVQGEDLTKEIGIEQKLGAQVPLDASFLDENGRKVQLGSFFSTKPVVLTPVFYRCVDIRGTCLLQLDGAAKSFKAMQNDAIGEAFEVVTISIHPKETPDLAAAKKAHYVAEYRRPSAQNGWHFLTGEYAQTRKVLDAVGYRFKYDPKKNQVVHPAGLIILTPDGRVSKYFYGADYPAKYLRDSIRVAATGQAGDRSVPILLGCFMYDETTGKTRLHVMNTLKVTGILTVLILGTSIFMMSFRGRRGKEGAL